MTEEIRGVLGRGIALLDAAEYVAAEELFRERVATEPGESEGYFYLGEALAEQNRLEAKSMRRVKQGSHSPARISAHGPIPAAGLRCRRRPRAPMMKRKI